MLLSVLLVLKWFAVFIAAIYLVAEVYFLVTSGKEIFKPVDMVNLPLILILGGAITIIYWIDTAIENIRERSGRIQTYLD